MDKLLGTIPKNELEEIRVRVRAFRGHPYIDIRVYWRTDPEEEYWRPSQKGVTLKPELVGELITALKNVEPEV